jgi:uncharacterized membrane protein (UPF0127 family)
MKSERLTGRRARHGAVLFAALALLLSAGLALAEPEANPATPPSGQASPVWRLFIGEHSLNVEIAQSQEQHERGLMDRARLDENAGMLFCNPTPTRMCMWMKETGIPLSVAFIDEQGVILSIRDMQPNTLDPHCSEAAVSYALETNQGWFSQRGVAPGSTIQGLPLPPPR